MRVTLDNVALLARQFEVDSLFGIDGSHQPPTCRFDITAERAQIHVGALFQPGDCPLIEVQLFRDGVLRQIARLSHLGKCYLPVNLSNPLFNVRTPFLRKLVVKLTELLRHDLPRFIESFGFLAVLCVVLPSLGSDRTIQQYAHTTAGLVSLRMSRPRCCHRPFEECLEHLYVDIRELLNVKTSLAGGVLAKFGQQLLSTFKTNCAVQNVCGLSRRKSDDQHIPFASALVSIVIAVEADD